ncbi:MAG TPA: hypothetical protein VNF07_06675 [Acidimicrobiales bacterium]|nr:hypothetical protein [Acidimicrobiales bacterium]
METRAGLTERFFGFALAHGLETALSDPDVVESFVVRGLPGRAASTRGTYRSVLLSSPGRSRRRRVGTPFPSSGAVTPYTSAERAELLSIASSQRHVAKANSALAIICFGIGAGLRPGELVALRGGDVAANARFVTVTVAGRRVPVGAPWQKRAVDLASAAGGGFLFRPGGADRTQKNFVTDLCDRIVADPTAPRLSAGRCRSSFVCDHLAAGTALAELVRLAGIDEVGSLLRYARHVPAAPQSKAALRERLALGSR